ncbi:serine palmitoyltransferase small subunit A [Zootermopsis nevadensis]|uniref:serine palmitoyltransferase small subunit A n=1 Tax=Zootermopsis nevadensis TaxID=136037 RepID=UPI000B8EE099|nr:serine palmitoyltransferase small subunit A [Zootermopsis nevadensis]
MIKSAWKFLCYWYFRYLMVTELYMVERWERGVVSVVFLILFLMLAYFNYAVILYATSSIIRYTLI